VQCRAVASVKEARGHQFNAGGGTSKSSAEGASVEAPQAPMGVGCGEGSVPLPRKFCFTFPC